jgi:outer membrane lipoprotein SlyB
MKKITQTLLLSLFIISFVSACASRSQSNYYTSEVGQQLAVEDVTIISSRLVTIEGLSDKKRPGWGTAVGAAVAGAAAYGVTEGDNPAGVAITIIAAIGGAIAGQFIDEKSKSSLGAEYLIRKANGEKVIIVQSVEDEADIIADNSPASMIGGSYGYVRVVPQ